ncbi:hypothetical protein FRC03_009913 [Tulasnella sp. 419]|nr:hypothetical protein FRC03_009913 [Tulasnella sp. 419]
MQNSSSYGAGGNYEAQANSLQPPSSDGADVVYPKIDGWLKELDSHRVRGQDGFNFAQYAPRFRTHKFIWIDQLADSQWVSVDKLAEWLDIEVGAAEAILRYATIDVKKLKRDGQQKMT